MPLLIGAAALYPWARPDAACIWKRFYLNAAVLRGPRHRLPDRLVRARRAILRALRRGADAALARLAPAGLILLAITVTFAAIDLTMSLDPAFNSSVYGMIATAGDGPAGAVGRDVRRRRRHASDGAGDDLGNGCCSGWSCCGPISISCSADRLASRIWPREAPWYIARSTGGWGVVAAGRGRRISLLPFCAADLPPVQRSRRGIACGGGAAGGDGGRAQLVAGAAGIGHGFGCSICSAMLGVRRVAAARRCARHC